ncbi:MAG: hypothetical protein GY820_48085 [Gammaproteobacteria bacterium]|nr:hypothetical protein [Gammaproteobacteria bacterium]
MRISTMTLLTVLAVSAIHNSVLAHETETPEHADANKEEEPSSNFALTFGFGGSSLDLDYQGEPEHAGSSLLRIDYFDTANNYALQLSSFSSFDVLDLFGDIFDCLFSGDDCDDEVGNTTTVSDTSFLYGWKKEETVYSLGLSYFSSENTVDIQNDYSTIGLVGNIRTELFWIVDGIVHLNINEEDSYAAWYMGYRFD